MKVIQVKTGFVLATALLFAVFVPKDVNAFTEKHDCSFCHSLHGAPGFILLNDTNLEVLCMSCHATAIGDTAAADVHVNKASSSYPSFRFTCLDCHDTHDSRDYDATNDGIADGTNIKLVGIKLDSSGLAKIDTPNTIYNTLTSDVAFEVIGKPSKNSPDQTMYSFADGDEDGDGDYDGICEVCHSQTTHHRRDDSGGDHTHNVGRICTACHAHSDNFNK